MYSKHLRRVSQECHQSNYLTVRHFSANGIELPLGEAEMKIFKRSAHAALPLARTYRSLAVRFARHTWRAC